MKSREAKEEYKTEAEAIYLKKGDGYASKRFTFSSISRATAENKGEKAKDILVKCSLFLMFH